jgi:class 3 adenylate cyclase
VLLAAAVALGMTHAGEPLDAAVFDAQLRAGRATSAADSGADILVVGIDEETLEVFTEPLALWHAHLGDFFEGMARAGPRALGVDLLLPVRSYDEILPGQDRRLLSGLLALKQARVPLVLAQTIDRGGRTRPVFPPIASIVGRQALGLALVAPDRDGVVRRVESEIRSERAGFRTFFGGLVQSLGGEPVEGLIDYRVGPAFAYLPFHEVVERIRSGGAPGVEADFAEKIVLLGSVQPFVDRIAAPVGLAAFEPESFDVPGILVYAQAVRSALGPGLLQPLGEVARFSLLLLATLVWWASARPRLGGLTVLMVALGLWGMSWALLDAGLVVPAASVGGITLLACASRVLLEVVEQRQVSGRLRRSFEAYVSPGVMDGILRGEIEPSLSGERRRICVLFSDVRGFTSISEYQPPEFVVELLNEYFEEMTISVHAHGGTVDKFIGDGLMAFFGAPNPLAEAVAEAGFACGRDMLARLEALNEGFVARGIEPIGIGVGLHVGDAVIGHLGSRRRHEYTAIGDTVNTAARLEGLCKSLGHPLVCSGEMAAALGGDRGLVDLGLQPLKGRAAIAVHGWKPGGARCSE